LGVGMDFAGWGRIQRSGRTTIVGRANTGEDNRAQKFSTF